MKISTPSLLILLLPAFLAGCESLTPAECATANWRQLGVQDGARGAHDRAASYYETCQPSEATAADLDRSEMTGATELIDALVAHWTQEGEVALAAFGPRLQAIAKALGQEQAAQGDSVDILCYTMF